MRCSAAQNRWFTAPTIAADERTEPPIFLKANTCVIGPDDPIAIPRWSNDVVFEGELAIVIKSLAKDVSVEDAPQMILGYTIANDATARDAMTGGPWSRGKSFDSACPLGPWITVDPALDVTNLAIRSYLNGEIAQDSSTAHMIWNPFELVSYVSHQMTLLPGDVIATGAPAGAQVVHAGDRVEIEIEGIGRLTNPVVRA